MWIWEKSHPISHGRQLVFEKAEMSKTEMLK
jgi:hypothetical protein